MLNAVKLSSMKCLKKYLFWFANEHADFRIAEIEAIVSQLKTTIEWNEKPSQKPFCVAELPSDQIAKEIADRSVTLKHITEIWATTSNINDLHQQLKQYNETTLKHDTSLSTATFKFNVELFCNTQSYAEKVARIESFSYLPFKGQVKLHNPDITLQYLEFYGIDPNNVPKEPLTLFFGKLIAKSQRKTVYELSLKKRKFIGNTSMDAELSLIMANSAKISEGDFVLDPFVGSGSLLVAAAYYGGYVFGVDIDYLMIHGKTKPTRKQSRHEARKDESVLANMKQYGLADHYIDVLVGDSSLPLWRPGLVLDAVITDPPYGIREATERIGGIETRKIDPSQENETKFPTKTVYGLHQILEDLLRFSAAHLKVGGRLVTWIPVFREGYEESAYVATHSCFTLISNCEQILSKMISRRLLTFEKIKEPKGEDINLCYINDHNFREKYFKYKYDISNKMKG